MHILILTSLTLSLIFWTSSPSAWTLYSGTLIRVDFMDFSWVLVHGCALFAVPVPSLKNSQLSSKCQWNKSLQLWHLRETKAFGWRGLGAGRKFVYHRTNKNYNTLIHGLRSISFSFILFLVNAIPLTSMHSSRMRTACLLTISQHALCRGGVSQHALGRGVCIPACTGQGSVCPGGVCLGVQGCVHRGGVCPGGMSAQGLVSSHGGCLPRGCTPVRYYRIWSTSGQYASYWNAFFSLNVFTEFSEFSDKFFVITVKGFEPDTSCVRHQDACTATARHMWDRIFKLTSCFSDLSDSLNLLSSLNFPLKTAV